MLLADDAVLRVVSGDGRADEQLDLAVGLLRRDTKRQAACDSDL
jgi:hypothetical protein